MKHLYVFSATYPYGFQESFLETELPFLINRFDSVTIVPFGGYKTDSRQLPLGCDVNVSLINSKSKRILIGLLGLWRVLPFYFRDLTISKALYSIKNLKKWAVQLFVNSYYLQSYLIRQLRKNNKPDDILLYFYWGVTYNTIAPFMKGHCKMVSRFHGDWDLWESQEKEGYFPIRDSIIRSLDAAVFISHIGEDFFNLNHKGIITKTFHLGSIDSGVGIKSTDGIVRVLSCSAVYPLKRVDLICDVVCALSRDYYVEWTHIGDGSSYEELKEKTAKVISEKLSINLIGRLTHSAVIEFYKNNPVDVFVNLSTNEGIPVSIMEAISFNVPVVATNVGGTAEIVREKSGILVDANPSISEVVKSINYLIKSNLTPRALWQEEFDASVNYSTFADFIYSL